MKVAYFGREGSFAHQAAVQRFGKTQKFLSCPSHPDVVDALFSRRADAGVLPLENSIAGVVMDSIDVLVTPEFTRSKFKIREHLQLRPDLVLLSCSSMEEIRRVYSHPYPFRYLAKWLKKNLPNAEKIETVSTSEASMLASEQTGTAAIAGPQAAKVYNLNILCKGLANPKEYLTRFCVISAKPLEKKKQSHVTLCFGLKHRPGALVNALSVLAKHRLNLTRILSRPLSSRTGKFDPDAYLFWVDVNIQGKSSDWTKAIRELKPMTTFLDVLGEYFIRPGC